MTLSAARRRQYRRYAYQFLHGNFRGALIAYQEDLSGVSVPWGAKFQNCVNCHIIYTDSAPVSQGQGRPRRMEEKDEEPYLPHRIQSLSFDRRSATFTATNRAAINHTISSFTEASGRWPRFDLKQSNPNASKFALRSHSQKELVSYAYGPFHGTGSGRLEDGSPWRRNQATDQQSRAAPLLRGEQSLTRTSSLGGLLVIWKIQERQSSLFVDQTP